MTIRISLEWLPPIICVLGIVGTILHALGVL